MSSIGNFFLRMAVADALEADEILGRRGQDERDGAALRRLREAAIRVGILDLHIEWADEGQDYPPFTISGWGYGGTGDTIAEAADKCRETL